MGNNFVCPLCEIATSKFINSYVLYKFVKADKDITLVEIIKDIAFKYRF